MKTYSTNLYIIGAGGHARVIMASAMRLGREGFFISKEATADLRSLPEGDFLTKYAAGELNGSVICGVGSVGASSVRGQIMASYIAAKCIFASIIDPSATISEDVVIGEGTYVSQGAQIVAGAMIGRHCILNTGSIVDHDCKIGDETHIAPGAVVLGGVTLGVGVLIGAGAVIRQGLSIGDGVVIGAGAVVTRSIENSESMWFGVPARQVF